MQPNRLERCWEVVKPEILVRWDRLSGYDLNGVGYDFDRLVETIRQRYHPARSKLSIEAEIRDWIISRIAEFEKEGS